MSNIKNIDSRIIIDVTERIERLIMDARTRVARVVNISEVVTRYEVGRVIFEVVQDGEERATYGKQLLKGVSEILTDHLGEGWSAETLRRCRKFFYLYSAKEISTTALTKSPNSNFLNSVDQISEQQFPQQC